MEATELMDSAVTLSYSRPSFFTLSRRTDRALNLAISSSTNVNTTTTRYDNYATYLMSESGGARIDRPMLLDLSDLEALHAPAFTVITVQEVLAKLGGIVSILVPSNEITTLQMSGNMTAWSLVDLNDVEGLFGHTNVEMRSRVSGSVSVLVASSEDRALRISGNIAESRDFSRGVAINLTFNAPAKPTLNTPPRPITPSITPAKSGLADRIAAERSAAAIDKECFETADAAARDAQVLFQRQTPGGSPRIMFSEEGILTLQWQRGEYGLALIFAGDGIASIAFKRPGQLYAENGLEVAIFDDLPTEFNEALAALLS
jgi:hypothetical protein